MGTPDFAVPALQALVAAGHEIACVYSQPPRPAGRGHKERPSPVHAAADALGLPVRTPASLKSDSAQADFGALALDAAVVAAYGLILPRPILDAPRLGCFNIHASLLPRWRGAAPIQRAILAGDAETGVTIMQMDEGLDTGPMLLAARIPITATTTAETLHDDLAALGARLITDALEQAETGALNATPQPDDGATYAKKLDRGESRVDWAEPADLIERKTRALNPWPGVWFDVNGARVKLLSGDVVAGNGVPGTVLDDDMAIACGKGAFRPARLQREGRRPAERAAFLRGNPLPKGTRLP